MRPIRAPQQPRACLRRWCPSCATPWRQKTATRRTRRFAWWLRCASRWQKQTVSAPGLTSPACGTRAWCMPWLTWSRRVLRCHMLRRCTCSRAALQVALRRGKDAATPLDVLGAFCGPLLSFLLLGKLSVEDALSAGALQACCAGLAGVHPTTSDTRYLWGLHKAIRLLDVLTADEPARADAALAAGALESVELHAPSMDRFYAPELIGIQMLGVEALFCPRPPGSARAALERVLERLRAAAAQHDVSPCAAPRCERCAAAKRTCALPSCGAADGPFKHCANCKRAAYCCREHQLADWSAHKADCKKWRIA